MRETRKTGRLESHKQLLEHSNRRFQKRTSCSFEDVVCASSSYYSQYSFSYARAQRLAGKARERTS